ncbi:MAG: phospholipase D-like domain-containing protein [Chitinophagaceae bacterium]
MRFKNESGPLKLYAVAGTQTVLLSFDIALAKIDTKNFLGFDIRRTDKDGSVHSLNGTKLFKSLMNDITVTDPKLKHLSLVQSFFWKDYTADPEQTYIYTVTAMSGTALHHQPLFASTIKVRTEPLQKGKHSVYFNYGVTGSQAYVKRFGDTPVNNLAPKKKEEALAMLGRELWKEGLIKFVQQANGKKFSLFGAFYEFQYPDFLKEIKAAKATGADVQIVFSAQPGQNKEPKANGTLRSNKQAIANAGITAICHPRTKANQPHNKFMVLCEDGKPKQVWTGSTNITPAGIFGQCNTGHWIVDSAIANKYMKYWTLLQTNPDLINLSAVSSTIQPDTDLKKLADGTYVFFSPRDLPAKKNTTPVHLSNYAKLIDSAKELVCMVFPFNIDDVFTKVYRKQKKYLRLLIFEKAAQAKSVKSNDINLKVTGGAILKTPVEEWAKEVSSKTTVEAGILYVHNKFFIIDPLGKDPVVISGSANFSGSSITSNDENSMLIKGDQRVADIYLTEFNRLFEHFWPRYLSEILPKNKNQGFEKPLDETFVWHKDYFDPKKYDKKRKDLFINMQGAVKG